MKFLKEISPREYQSKILESCTDENCLVVLPTGLGKTLIALMLSIKRMERFPGEKVVFLAPTKPLAEQHLFYFKKNLPELFADMQLFTGSVKPLQRRKIWKTADIIFSTPQCVANDIKKNLYDLKEVCLLIEDEAHRCIKNYDYNFIAKTYQETSENPRILGLTASPGSESQKIKEICKNLSINKVELRTRESPDVKHYLQELRFEKIFVEFPPEFQEIKHILQKLINQYTEELKLRKVLFGPSTKIALIELQKKISSTLSRHGGQNNYNYLLGASACAQAIKLHHALELLETQTLQSFSNYINELKKQASKKQSKGVIKLVSKPEFNFIFLQSSELLSKNKEHPKIEKLEEVIRKEFEENQKTKLIVFTQFRDTAKKIEEQLKKINSLNILPKVFVGQAIKTINGEKVGLKQKEQKKILDHFRENKINILIATSIAEEGLDIPEVNGVIFYEPVPSAIRSIQRAGRTARLNKGKLITLITKGTRDEIFFYAARAREKKMKNAIEKIQKDLDSGIKFNTYSEEQRKL